MALEIPQFQAPDLVGPLATAMALHEKRQNAETQRMFAENQMRRQSAQDLREQKKFDQEQEELKRTHGIQQAQAFQQISHMQPGDPNAAVMGGAYGIDVHPLFGATQAAMPGPTQIDTSKQSLPSNSDSNDLAPDGMGAPPEQQSGASDADLEALMRQASTTSSPTPSSGVDRELAGSRETAPNEPATPLLYEAVMNGQHYKLDRKPTAVFGDPKYDAQLERLLTLPGMTPEKAGMAVLAQKEKDDNAAAIADRMNSGIDARTKAKAEEDARYRQTAEERTAQFHEAEGGRNARATDANRTRIATAGMSLGERKSEHEEKKEDKEDQTAVRDEGGNVIGHVPTGRGGAQGFATRDADYGRAIDQLQALAEHVKKYGDRVGPMHTKDRDTLYNNAAIGVATVSPLGKTNESVELEKGSIGHSGAPSLSHPLDVAMGANLPAIQNKIREMKEQRDRYRKQTLIPVKGASGSGPRKLSKEEISGGSFLP